MAGIYMNDYLSSDLISHMHHIEALFLAHYAGNKWNQILSLKYKARKHKGESMKYKMHSLMTT